MNKITLVLILILTLIIYITYWPGLFLFFSGDTLWAIRTFRSASLGELLSKCFTPQGVDFYRPIPILYWGVNTWLWGLNPMGYRLTGLTIQAINVLLVFGLIGFCFQNIRLAFLVSIIFGTHYLSWLWVYEQGQNDQQFFVMFYVLSTIYLLRYELTHRKSALCFTLLFYILSLLSKEQSTTTILSFPLWIVVFKAARRPCKQSLFRQCLLQMPKLKYHFAILITYLIYRTGFMGVSHIPGNGFMCRLYPDPIDFFRHFYVYISRSFYKGDNLNLILFFACAVITLMRICLFSFPRKDNSFSPALCYGTLSLSGIVFFTPLIITALFQRPSSTAPWHLSLSILGSSILYAGFLYVVLDAFPLNSISYAIATAVACALVILHPLFLNRHVDKYWPRVNSLALKHILSSHINIHKDASIRIKGIETEDEFENSNFRDFFKLYWGNSVDVGFLPANTSIPPPARNSGQVIIFEFKNGRLLLANADDIP